MADPIGAKLTVDISELKARIAQANNLIKENEREWRVNASTMDDWTKSEKGLSDRMETLSKDIKTYQDNIEELTKDKKIAIAQYGEESEEVKALNKMLDSQLRAIERSKKEYKQVSTSLDKMKSSTNNAGKETKELGSEIDLTTKETKDMTKESKKADKALDSLEKEAKDAGEGFTIAKGAIAGFVANGLTAIVSGVSNAVSSLFGLTEATAEYRREMGRITTVAEQVGVSGDRIIDKWIDVNSVINDDASVTEGLNNLMTAGFATEKELDGITKALEGAAIQWSDTLKFEGLSDSLQEWIGSDGANLTGQFAELLERLGYNLEDVTEQTKNMTDEQRRNWAIQTLNKEGMAGVSDAYREANADLIAYNKANADLVHAQSQLGEAMQPFVTTVKQSTADILYSFMDMANGVEGAGDQLLYNVGYLAGTIYDNVKNVIEMMLPVVQSLIPKIIDFITTNLPSMVEQGIAIITNIINGISQKIPEVLSQVSAMLIGIIQMITDNAPALLNSALNLLGQIVLAVPEITIQLAEALPTIITSIMDGLWNGENSVYDTAIALLGKIVEAIPPLLERLWQELPTIIDTISQSLSEAIPKVFDGSIVLLGQIVEAIPQIVVDLISNLPKIITSIINFLGQNGGKILSGAVELLMNIVFAIPEIVVEIGKKMPEIINGIINGLLAGTAGIFKAGYDLIAGLVDGMFDFDIVGKLKSLGSSIVGGIKSFFGIHSPSTLMADEVGEPIAQGVAVGIEDATDDVLKVAEGMSEETVDSFTQGWQDAMNGKGKTTVAKVTSDVVKEAGKAVESTAKAVGKEIGTTIAEATKEFSIADVFNDAITTVSDLGETDELGSDAILAELEKIPEALGSIEEATKKIKDQNLLSALLGDSDIKEAMENAGLGEDAGLDSILPLINGNEDLKKAYDEILADIEAEQISADDLLSAIVEKPTGKELVDTILADARSEDIAKNFMSVVGQLGPWGSLAETIYNLVMDNLVNFDQEKYQEIATKFADDLMNGLMTMLENLPVILKTAIEFLRVFALRLIEALPTLIKELPKIIVSMCESFISDGIPALFEVGVELIMGLIEGMLSINVIDVVKGIGNGIVNGFKKLFGIKSPSKVMADEVGKNLAFGIEEGLTDNIRGVNDALRNGVDTSLEMDGIQRKQVNVYQTNNYSQAHSRYEIYKSKRDTANAVRLAMQGV